jgi:hypothetical protein
MSFRRPVGWCLLTLLIAAVGIEQSGAASLPASPAIARIEVVVATGELSIRRGANILAANSGDTLQAGDRLETGTAAGAVLLTTNGVEVALGAKTSLMIEDVGSNTVQPKFTFEHGEVFIAIRHLAPKAPPLVVTTSIGSVSSTGARIRLTYTDATDRVEFSCSCVDGSAAFRQVNCEPVRIPPGSVGTVTGPKDRHTTLALVPLGAQESATLVQTFQRLVDLSAAVRAR